MRGHRTRFRGNGDLPPWSGSAAKEKPAFFNARVLMTLEIMCSRVVQCNTGNYLESALTFSTFLWLSLQGFFYIKRNPQISEIFFQDQTSTLWHRLMMQYMMAWGQWKMLLKMVRSLTDNWLIVGNQDSIYLLWLPMECCIFHCLLI